MKKQTKKLVMQTIRVLDHSDLGHVAGGWIRPPITWSCPQPSQSQCCPKTDS